MDSNGESDPPTGVREFVVGTGGFSHYPFPGAPLDNGGARDATAYGILLMRLYPERHEWGFVPVTGDAFTDSGGADGHPPPA